ncbi:MAG TPA: multiheme c-type cytochrome, partial [Polyangiaceae bacterium]|nr:multiheme c-type cytochrome [Polyangiaceae bacterium]
ATGIIAGAVASAPRALAPAPVAIGRDGFATSKACRSCHPAEYASWHQSYHRRMTQSATTEAVAAPSLTQGGRLRAEATGRTVELFARGEQLWASVPDPSLTLAAASEGYERAFRTAPLRDVQVQLLTGSHHHQAFWIKGARQDELRALPVVYLIDEARLVARRDAFLNPPEDTEHPVRWNSNCVQCHAVAGAPSHDEQRDAFETSAAELGIACEACHGAGEAHVRAMRSPLHRYEARTSTVGAAELTNPRKLVSERSSQVCGRCHSYFFPRREAEWWRDGFSKSYAPGQDLALSQLLLSREVLAEPGAPELGASAQSLFYDDGTIRVGGREYNGLVRSPCYERGHGDQKLSCLSCHSLHRGAPNGQLDPEKLGNGACATCHERESSNVAAHSHHAPSSAGSLCYNCHMPHVSYALLGAIRSHRIDSPSFDARTRDRPNACNLCHLERSEAWAAQQSRAWFGAKASFELDRAPELSAADTPAGAVFALAGDAAVRAVTAAALGRHESAVDAPELRQQLLGELARDDYAAVRLIAERARRSAPTSSAAPPLPSALVERLLAARDRRPVTIAE